MGSGRHTPPPSPPEGRRGSPAGPALRRQTPSPRVERAAPFAACPRAGSTRRRRMKASRPREWPTPWVPRWHIRREAAQAAHLREQPSGPQRLEAETCRSPGRSGVPRDAVHARERARRTRAAVDRLRSGRRTAAVRDTAAPGQPDDRPVEARASGNGGVGLPGWRSGEEPLGMSDIRCRPCCLRATGRTAPREERRRGRSPSRWSGSDGWVSGSRRQLDTGAARGRGPAGAAASHPRGAPRGRRSRTSPSAAREVGEDGRTALRCPAWPHLRVRRSPSGRGDMQPAGVDDRGDVGGGKPADHERSATPAVTSGRRESGTRSREARREPATRSPVRTASSEAGWVRAGWLLRHLWRRSADLTVGVWRRPSEAVSPRPQPDTAFSFAVALRGPRRPFGERL